MWEKLFLKSVRAKLFFTLCIVILMIIGFFVIINNVMLEAIYYYSKYNAVLDAYNFINENIPKEFLEEDKTKYELELEKLSANNSFEILLLNGEDILYATNKNYLSEYGTINEIRYDVEYSIFNKSDIMYSKDGVSIRKIKNKVNGITYILMDSNLENENKLYIRLPITPIQDSVSISNSSIYAIGLATIILGGIAIVFITERFTKPIEELNDIANEMSNLNFKRKYRIHDTQDEIDELGKSINTLSDKLEDTIHKLKLSNAELEKDIENKSKIDEMRKQFISDVSHELKTPIALIQGYAEGLVDGVITDEENKKFYQEVILDEANKMDKLVKRLLELMKLEYEDRKFNDSKFDIVEVINEVIKNSKVVLDPTMLLTKEEWEKVMDNTGEGERYALVYDFMNSPLVQKEAMRIAKEKGLKLYAIGDQRLWYCNRNYIYAGPDTFLSLIRNASYIVSNSFHGTAFAILFQIPYSVIDREDGLNVRMHDLQQLNADCLHQLQLESMAYLQRHCDASSSLNNKPRP